MDFTFETGHATCSHTICCRLVKYTQLLTTRKGVCWRFVTTFCVGKGFALWYLGLEARKTLNCAQIAERPTLIFYLSINYASIVVRESPGRSNSDGGLPINRQARVPSLYSPGRCTRDSRNQWETRVSGYAPSSPLRYGGRRDGLNPWKLKQGYFMDNRNYRA